MKLIIFTAAILFSAMTSAQPNLYYSFGDSITAGIGPSAVQNRYANLLANQFQTELKNFAVSGQTACMMSDTQVFRQISTGPLPHFATLMIGTNDSNVQGEGTYEGVYERCLRAAITWIATPIQDKVFASSCTTEGTWTAFDKTAGALQATERNSRLTCKFKTENSPVYFWFAHGDDLDGSFVFKVDNQPEVNVKTKSPVQIKTTDGRGLRGQTAFRYTGLAPGEHTIRFTITSTNQSPVILYGVGSVKAASKHLPLFIGGVPFQLHDQKAAASAKYNKIAGILTASLKEQGFNIHFVDVRSFITSAPRDMVDGLHPSDQGNLRLFEAFSNKIKEIYNNY